MQHPPAPELENLKMIESKLQGNPKHRPLDFVSVPVLVEHQY